MRYVAFLRGINVSGKNMIKMEDLRILSQEIGLEDVQTYIQSGNIVYESSMCEEAVEQLLNSSIKKNYGYDVDVIVKKQEDIQLIIDKHPFINDNDTKAIYFTLLAQAPTQELLSSLPLKGENNEDFLLKDNVIYLYYQNGYGKTKLTNKYFENKLKIKATTRNYNTMVKLASM